jgi:hypothetical protein
MLNTHIFWNCELHMSYHIFPVVIDTLLFALCGLQRPAFLTFSLISVRKPGLKSGCICMCSYGNNFLIILCMILKYILHCANIRSCAYLYQTLKVSDCLELSSWYYCNHVNTHNPGPTFRNTLISLTQDVTLKCYESKEAKQKWALVSVSPALNFCFICE